MMFFNNSNNKSGFSKQETDRHKTHVTALVLLVLVTLVVVFAALSMADSTQPPVDRSLVRDAQLETTDTQMSSLEKVSDLSGLPADLPMPESAVVTQNYRNDLTDGQTQRILVFNTQADNTENQLLDQMQSWATDNGFAIIQTNRTNGAGIILAKKPSAQLIVSWSDTEDSTRVEINHVRI